MRVVRQWMTKFFKNLNTRLGCTPLLFLMTLTACNPTELPSSGRQAGLSYSNGSMANKAYIYRDSPAITEGPNYGPGANMASSVDKYNPEMITVKSQLKGDCEISLYIGSSTITDCIQTFSKKSASQQLLNRKPDGSWVFPINSPEFYQVNGHYLVKNGVDTFHSKLKFAFDTIYTDPTLSYKTKQIPKYLPDSGMYWFQAISNDNYFKNSFLSTYSLCDLELNALFKPAGPELCFGKWSAVPSFFMVQDPSVVYHELGHALVAVMMNFRNGIPGFPSPNLHSLRSNLGGGGYDEAGSLGEGIADYYSFIMTKRTHIGEWALKRSLNAGRPMSEDDEIHITGIDTSAEGRLSYPLYLHYDPNQPNVPYEDVHYAGQIVSHYLVALTKKLQNECSIPTADLHDKSTSYILLLLADTLSELGDLRAVGLDTSAGNPLLTSYRFTNLDEFSSYMWSHVVNPPTYRRFFQVFGKNIVKYISEGFCPGFTQSESEKLLDDYGLLLFKTYNDDGTSTKYSNVEFNSTGGITINGVPSKTIAGLVNARSVQESNRRKSVLVSKSLLEWATPDTEKEIVKYYVIDDQTNMSNILANLLFKGYPINPSTGISSIEYNNSNVRISPGEIVAIIPNLYNASNSTIAGVHLLATDWDHVDITDTTGINGNFKPCVVDDVTTLAQGAENGGSCTTNMSNYKRHVKGVNGLFGTEAAAPVCLVQLEDGEVTRWVSQNEFRKSQGLSLQDKDCLGYAGTPATEDFTFNPHECLVRILPGAQDAFFSKIEAQKSYAESVRTGNPDFEFNPGNAIIFEVNKWIPPGTKFRCRMRATFSNCSDCFVNPVTNDEYIDSELNGANPYKIINFEFDVND